MNEVFLTVIADMPLLQVLMISSRVLHIFTGIEDSLYRVNMIPKHRYFYNHFTSKQICKMHEQEKKRTAVGNQCFDN